MLRRCSTIHGHQQIGYSSRAWIARVLHWPCVGSRIRLMKTCPTCNASFSSDLSFCPTHGAALIETEGWVEGALIWDIYRILGKLGQTWMTALHRAKDVRFETLCVLEGDAFRIRARIRAGTMLQAAGTIHGQDTASERRASGRPGGV